MNMNMIHIYIYVYMLEAWQNRVRETQRWPPSITNVRGARQERQKSPEREFFIDNLLARIHRCFWCTGLAPWEFESPFPGSLLSTFLGPGCSWRGRSRLCQVRGAAVRGDHTDY